MPWRCPHDGSPLEPVVGGVACPAGHRFDRAAEGYLHLLPAGRKRGHAAGDSAEMVAARRELFDSGHYAPMLGAVAAAVGDALGGTGRTGGTVLDAGCGEGAYLRAVGAAVPDAVRLGVDVAKPAVRLAARRDAGGDYAVASSHRLPLADGAVDVAVSVFAPRPWPELARVLGPAGRAVVASPGADHLDGVRRLLYDHPAPHDPRAHLTESEVAGWQRLARRDVRFELEVHGADVERLVRMTPYWWSAPTRHVTLPRTLTTTVDVVVTTHAAPGAGTVTPAG